MYAINYIEEDIDIDIHPQEVQPFDVLDDSEDFFDSGNSSTEEQNAYDRLTRIINSLRLDQLNQEEKDHVIKIIKDYQPLFHITGNKLPATNVMEYEIHTTDEAPVFIKQYRYPPIHKEEIQRQMCKLLHEGRNCRKFHITIQLTLVDSPHKGRL